MLLVRKVCIVDINSPHNGQVCDMMIEESGHIAQIAAGGTLSGEGLTIIEMDGLHVSPGWVDMQTHLSEPGYEWKETLSQTALAAQKGGFTHIVVYPNTAPVLDNAQSLIAAMQSSKNQPITLLFTGALTHGAEGKDFADVFELKNAGAVALTDGLFSSLSAGLVVRLRQYMSAFDGWMFVYPYEKSLTIDGMMNEGKAAVEVGMKGIPQMSEAIGVGRELQLHEYCPLRTHFQPITSPDALDLLAKAKQQRPEISVGTAIPYLAFSDEDLQDFDTHLKLFPPLRSKNQIASIKKHLQQSTIDVLTSAHFPQGLEEKEVEFEVAEYGMLGLQTAFALANQVLVQTGDLSLSHLIKCIAHTPRTLLGLPSASIQQGAYADLTFFHPHLAWTLSPTDIPSTAKNSPLIGKPLRGKAVGIFHQQVLLWNE